MSSEDLWQIVKSGRSERLDWLSENAPLDTMATILTAMANSHGGTLVLGIIGPTATVVGVRDAGNAIDRVIQAALSVEPPLIIPMPRAVPLKDKQVDRRPHPAGNAARLRARRALSDAGRASRIRRSSRATLRRLIIERGELSFETEIAHGTSRDDIDWDKAKAYVSDARRHQRSRGRNGAAAARLSRRSRMDVCAPPTPGFCCSAKTRSATFAARRSPPPASPATR